MALVYIQIIVEGMQTFCIIFQILNRECHPSCRADGCLFWEGKIQIMQRHIHASNNDSHLPQTLIKSKTVKMGQKQSKFT